MTAKWPLLEPESLILREGEHSYIHWSCDGPCRSDPPHCSLGRRRSSSGDSVYLSRDEGASVGRGAGESSSVTSVEEYYSPGGYWLAIQPASCSRRRVSGYRTVDTT